MSRVLLKGHVTEGMFPNERVVVVRDIRGNEITVIVGANLVTHYGGHDGVEVRILEKGSGVWLVRVPGEVFGMGNVLSVPQSELVSTG